MDIIIMNSENRKTSDPYRLWLNLSDKINLKRSDKYVALSNLSIYYAWKNIKKSWKNNKFKMEWRVWITWWVIICIRYWRLLWMYLEKNSERISNLLIYVNKI